jgi:hypothetical protein
MIISVYLSYWYALWLRQYTFPTDDISVYLSYWYDLWLRQYTFPTDDFISIPFLLIPDWWDCSYALDTLILLFTDMFTVWELDFDTYISVTKMLLQTVSYLLNEFTQLYVDILSFTFR